MATRLTKIRAARKNKSIHRGDVERQRKNSLKALANRC